MNMQTATRQKPNWDELGKLYLFPVDNPEFKSQGIKSQWFLTHQQDDRLFAGHINDRGEWSLCEDKDLTPSHNYQPVDRIWQLLSKDRLIEQPKSIVETQKLKNEDDTDNNDQPVQLDKKKKTLVNVGKIPFAPTNQDIFIEMDEEELIAHEERERKWLQLQKEQEEYLLDFAEIEFVSGEVSENIPTELVPEEEEKSITITAKERDLLEPVVHWGNHQDHTGSLLESDLQTLLWQGCEEDLLDVENQDPHQPWLIELEEDTGYIKLVATEDNHTVICIDQDGAIVEGLSLEDADLLMDGLISPNQEQDKHNHISIPGFGININQEKKQTEWEID